MKQFVQFYKKDFLSVLVYLYYCYPVFYLVQYIYCAVANIQSIQMY